MKKMFFRVILAIALFTGVSQVSNAQRVFVKIQPVAPVEVRVAPRRQGIFGLTVNGNGGVAPMCICPGIGLFPNRTGIGCQAIGDELMVDGIGCLDIGEEYKALCS